MATNSAGPDGARHGPLLLVHLGTRLALCTPDGGEVAGIRLPSNGEDIGRIMEGTVPEHVERWARQTLGKPQAPTVFARDPLSASVLKSLGLPVRSPRTSDLRRARTRSFAALPPREMIALGSAELGARLSSREEQVMSLSRECDRLERVLRKDEELTTNLSLVSFPGTAVERYLRDAGAAVSALQARRLTAERSLTEETQALLPNTSTLLGVRTAARLLEAAGSLRALSMMGPGRIQLIGARRRTPGRGPRYGLLFLSEGMESVPFDRRGALARTLASLASVAVRADTQTHSDITPLLRTHKETRIRELSQRRAGGDR